MVKLNSEKFYDFFRCLKVMDELLYQGDADIKEGIFRQLNPTKTCLVEMDLSCLISSLDLSIHSVNILIDKLSPFIRSKSSVEIETIDNFITFSNKSTLVKCKKFPQYVNSFIDNTKFSNIITEKEENLLFNYLVSKDISKLIKSRIKKYLPPFYIDIIFEEDNASLTIFNGYEVLAPRIKLNQQLPKSQTRVHIKNFTFDHNGYIVLKVYTKSSTGIETNPMLHKFISQVGNVDVTIDERSFLKLYTGPEYHLVNKMRGV